MDNKKILVNICVFAIVMSTVILILIMTMNSLNSKDFQEEFEKNCQRVSMNEYEDNCFCGCDDPNWVERMLRLGTLCDGWIVNKNESCIYGVEHMG